MLNPREQRLLTIVLITLAAYVAYGAVQWLILRPLRERNQTLTALQQTIQRKKLQRRQVLQQQQQLQDWQKQSLPPDPRQAQSIYHQFLLHMVNEVGLDDPVVNTMPPAPQGNALVRYPFTIRGRGSLETVMQLLGYFERVNVLHQIRQLSLRRRDDGDRLEVELRVEAISIQDATEDGVSSIAAAEEASESTQELLARILERNIFSPPRPPQPPPVEREPETPPVDPRQFVYLVGCVAVGSECEAWVYDRLNNRLHRLRAGDTLEVAGVKGRVVHVADGEMVYENEGTRYRLLLGQNFTQVQPVQSARAGSPEVEDRSQQLLPVAASQDN